MTSESLSPPESPIIYAPEYLGPMQVALTWVPTREIPVLTYTLQRKKITSWEAPILLTPDRIDSEVEGYDHLTETGFKDVKTNLRTTKYLDTLQDYDTYYYWRVIATNQHGDSSPSVPTTGIETPSDAEHAGLSALTDDELERYADMFMEKNPDGKQRLSKERQSRFLQKQMGYAWTTEIVQTDMNQFSAILHEKFLNDIIDRLKDTGVGCVGPLLNDETENSQFPQTVESCENLLVEINEIDDLKKEIGESFIINNVPTDTHIEPTTLVYRFRTSKAPGYSSVAGKYFSNSTLKSILESSTKKIPVDLLKTILPECRLKKAEVDKHRREEKIRAAELEKQRQKNQLIEQLEERGLTISSTDIIITELGDLLHNINKLLNMDLTVDEKKLVYQNGSNGKLIPQNENQVKEIITKINERYTREQGQIWIDVKNEQDEKYSKNESRRQDFGF